MNVHMGASLHQTVVSGGDRGVSGRVFLTIAIENWASGMALKKENEILQTSVVSLHSALNQQMNRQPSIFIPPWAR